jgi:phosphoribosyl 1,2-cyclic phosphodiesterase
MAFGGNTSCLEVEAAGHRVILDSGTGIRELGLALEGDGAREFFLLLTHTHWDHINGFPFFAPASREGNTVHVRAGHLADAGGVRTVFEGQMTQPMFPVPLDSMEARLSFEDFRAGDAFALQPGVKVKTAPLRHPNGATGYRIESGGSSLCYVTDTEHVPGAPDENVLGLIEGADLVVYDSTYTDEEFPAKVGWGHSTWQEGLRLCRAAGARRLAIFHHDPAHDDAFMARVERAAAGEWDGALVAREGLTLTLP